jgi:hypothetical protein
MGQIFQKTCSEQHIISNFREMNGVVIVNSDLAKVFEMGQIFQKI